MQRKIRVVHVINSFEHGGAEAMLCNLLLRTDFERFDPAVVALIDDRTVAGPILDAGIPLTTMGMKPGIPDPRGVARLAAYFRRNRPDVVQTWMDHSNLITALAVSMSPPTRLIWGIHHANHLPGLAKRSTLLTVSACALLSHRWPARIVFCSRSSRQHYERRGFAREKMVLIPNGFDTDRFRPDRAAGESIRQALAIPPHSPVIGIVARYDPLKDHANFLRAAAILARDNPEARYILCGQGVSWDNSALAQQIDALGLRTQSSLLGPRCDMPRIYAALDICCSASISEAFPLTIGEAMSCGVPCVATDVGDSALIVGGTGRIVPSRDPDALAKACQEMLGMSEPARRQLGMEARQRIQQEFELSRIVRQYESLYIEVAGLDRESGVAAAAGG